MIYRFRHRIVGPVVVIWLVLTLASVLVKMIVWHQLSNNFENYAEATRLGAALDQLYSTLQDAESSERDYLLTGDESYLGHFTNAEASLPKLFTNLGAFAMKDSVLQHDLLELRGLSELKMSDLRDTLKLRQDKGLPAALAQMKTGKGKDAMDKIRDLATRMRRDRNNFFSNTAGQARQEIESELKFTVFAGILGVGAGILALALVRVGYLQEQNQRQLLQEKTQAEKVLLEKSAFLANMSHEIRTPMNAILGFGELLDSEQLTPKQSQYVRSIRQSGKSLLLLINDVLDLSKLEAGKLQLNPEPTDLREVANFLQTMFMQQAAKKSLRLEMDVDEMPQALLLDRLRLRQVLVNLVGNAIKFTEAGFVRTRARWEPQADDRGRGALLIDVEDSGVGISPETQKAIFEPFVQSDPRRGAEHEGSGLGLSIVQRFTEIMGGTITLESVPGKGSCFHLRFEDVAVSARLAVTDMGDDEKIVCFDDFQPATLLVVDDNEANRNLIVGMFDGTRHRLHVARNGREALERIGETKFDLVLMDIRMPEMDGRTALAEIRKLPGMELLPVIAVTASSQPENEPELRGRFNGYIRKPFSRQTLHHELGQFLTRTVQKAGPFAEVADAELDGPPMATARKADSWADLTARLRLLQATEWVVLCETLAINDTQVFARKLHVLARATGCQPLAAYADTLFHHAQTYAVHDLERHLSGFPDLMKTIEIHSGQT